MTEAGQKIMDIGYPRQVYHRVYVFKIYLPHFFGLREVKRQPAFMYGDSFAWPSSASDADHFNPVVKEVPSPDTTKPLMPVTRILDI